MTTEPTRLTPPAPRLLTGDERIGGTSANVRDFWAWALSDLRANTVRSVFAEFLVAQALDATARPRVEWDSCDVLTPEGDRLEVKAGAYLQAWSQTRLSSVTFGGLRSRTWSPQAGYSAEQSYNADAYVFAVQVATEHDRYDPLDVDQWSFWVLARSTLAATGQRSITLSRVMALAEPPVTYAGLPTAVHTALGRPVPRLGLRDSSQDG